MRRVYYNETLYIIYSRLHTVTLLVLILQCGPTDIPSTANNNNNITITINRMFQNSYLFKKN